MAREAADLAERFERAVAACIQVVEGLSEAQWRRHCPAEQCSVAALTRHFAGAIPWEMRAF